MALSCSCDYDDDYSFYWETKRDYSTLDTKRGRRCISCNALIPVGSTVLRHDRTRYFNNDIEERIYGDGPDVPMTPQYHCEKCADLYFSFNELGFECVSPSDNMLELAKEYAHEYGPVRA